MDKFFVGVGKKVKANIVTNPWNLIGSCLSGFADGIKYANSEQERVDIIMWRNSCMMVYDKCIDMFPMLALRNGTTSRSILRGNRENFDALIKSGWADPVFQDKKGNPILNCWLLRNRDWLLRSKGNILLKMETYVNICIPLELKDQSRFEIACLGDLTIYTKHAIYLEENNLDPEDISINSFASKLAAGEIKDDFKSRYEGVN